MTTSTPGPADAALLPPYGPGPTPFTPVRIGEVVRDVERLAVQAQAVLDREVDPASLPANEHLRSTVEIHRLLAGFHLERVLQELAALASVALPARGSAVPVRFPTTYQALPVPAPAVGVRPTAEPGFLPGPGEKTTRIGGKHRQFQPPPRWPLRTR